jgi:hypothetical protein
MKRLGTSSVLTGRKFVLVWSQGRAQVLPKFYDYMMNGNPLSVSDVALYGNGRVKGDAVIRYLREQGTVYYLSPPDIDYLHNAGIAQDVIDYMMRTAAPVPAKRHYASVEKETGIMFGPYWHHWHWSRLPAAKTKTMSLSSFVRRTVQEGFALSADKN